MTKSLVIGGRGYYGARVVATVGALEGVEVTAGSRRGDGVIDLKRPETFGVMGDFALVVNASDTVNAPPDAALRWCLERGVPFFDMGADAPAVERLLALEAGDGTAVVGVGGVPGAEHGAGPVGRWPGRRAGGVGGAAVGGRAGQLRAGAAHAGGAGLPLRGRLWNDETDQRLNLGLEDTPNL